MIQMDVTLVVAGTRAEADAPRKYCMLCRLWIPLDDYGRDRTRKDGRDPRCKVCRTAYRADRKAAK